MTFHSFDFSGLENEHYTGDLNGLASAASLEVELQQVRLKILRLLDHAAALNQKYNSFNLVCNLPPEVLLRIFALCTYRHDLSNARRWLGFSQVCSEWRRWALGDPSLWAHLDCSTPKLASLMSSRIQSVPVSLHIPIEALEFDFLPPRAQIRSLTLSYTSRLPPASVELANDYFSASFAELDTLVLYDHARIASTAPIDMTALQAPRLRTVALWEFNFRAWDASFLCNITNLTISLHYSRRPSAEPTVILELLKRNLGLQWLKLEGCMTTPDRLSRPGRLKQVSLCDLRHLELRDESINLAWLLSHLRVPQVEEIELWSSEVFTDAKHFHKLRDGLNDCLQSANWAPLRYAKVDVDVNVVVKVYCQEPHAGAQPSRPCLTIKLFQPSEDAMDTFCSSFAVVLPIQELSSLYLSTSVPDALVLCLWRSASKLPNLLTLELHDRAGRPLEGIFRSLCPLLKFPGEEWERAKDHFPALKTLRLRGLDLTHTIGPKTPLVLLEIFVLGEKLEKNFIHVVLCDCKIPVTEMSKLTKGQTDDERVLLMSTMNL